MVYYIIYVLFLLLFWCPCMVINVSIQYNGGLLPDIILLTQCYFHRGTRLNAMKRLCICSPCNSILLLPCVMVYYIVLVFKKNLNASKPSEHPPQVEESLKV